MWAGLFISTASWLPFACAEMRVSTAMSFVTSFLILSPSFGRIQPLSMNFCQSASEKPPSRSSRCTVLPRAEISAIVSEAFTPMNCS